MKYLLFICALASFLLSACESDQNVTARLTSRERTRIDTLYAEQVTTLRPQWDSLCTAQHDSLVAAAVDSIVRIRTLEEERLRRRILQEKSSQ